MYHMLQPFRSIDFSLHLLIISIVISVAGCSHNNQASSSKKESYSFFVAGHTFGMPGVDNRGLHPPFENQFTMLNDMDVKLGFLIGDIVKQGTKKDWDGVDSVLNKLSADVYFAVGNHDMTDRALFESRYGSTYFDFKYQDDLFIVLDPNIDFWNISGDQLKYLQQVLNTKAKSSRYVFVFFHQILWWEKYNQYRKYYPNSTVGRADTINFWSEIEPMFHKLDNKVLFFAGDIGAVGWSDNFTYDHYDNITFMATGMGQDKGDNYLIIHVPLTEDIRIELIPLRD